MATTSLQRNDNTFILKDAFYPILEKAFKNPNQIKVFVRYVANYRNRNLDILTRIYPTKTLYFDRNGDDAKIVFNTCNVTEKEVAVKLKEAKSAILLDQMKSDANIELCILLVMMMKYFYTNKEVIYAIKMYYVYAIWHVVYKKYFSQYNPTEEVVEYTINELDNRFDVKKYGSLDAALEKLMTNVLIWAEDKLERLSDKDIIDIIQSIRTRVNGMNKLIGNKIYENAKAGNKIFEMVETDSEGKNIGREGSAGMISNLVSTKTTNFFTNGVQGDSCKRAASYCEVSESELRTAISLIMKDNCVREVKLFYECLYNAFFTYYPHAKMEDAKGLKFVGAANAIYKKGNSTDKNIIKIKELSHEWLKRGSAKYNVTNRAATLNSFRKAIYLYFVFVSS